MTGNEIVTDLRSEILEPSPTFFSQSRMLTLINLAQNEYVRNARVLQSFAYTSTVAGQADYPMPADWLGSEKVFYNDTQDGVTPNWRPLSATNLEKLGQEDPNFLSTATSVQWRPRKYYVIGTTLYIYPRPANAGSNDLFLFYESKPIQLVTLNDSLSVDDTLYPGIRAYVLSKLWKQDNELDRAKEEMETFKDEVGKGRKWKNKRILDGKWKLDIESYTGFSYGGGSGNMSGLNPLNQ